MRSLIDTQGQVSPCADSCPRTVVCALTPMQLTRADISAAVATSCLIAQAKTCPCLEGVNPAESVKTLLVEQYVVWRALGLWQMVHQCRYQRHNHIFHGYDTLMCSCQSDARSHQTLSVRRLVVAGREP